MEELRLLRVAASSVTPERPALPTLATPSWTTVAAMTALVGCGDAADPVVPANRPPVAVASADPTRIPAGDDHRTVVTLDGSASTDPDGDALSFAWDVPGGRFVGENGPNDAVTTVTFPGEAPYVVTLTVSDDRGARAATQVTVSVGSPANRPPVAAVTADPVSVPEMDNHRTVVTLDGSASWDPDGDALTYEWSVPGGTFLVAPGPGDAVVRVTFPGNAPYRITLIVRDGRGGEDVAMTAVAVVG